jgi:large subunit ribosomal protein L30
VSTRTKKAAAGKIVIEQYRSGICCQEPQKRTLKALGFRRLWQRIEHPDNDAIRGMIGAIPHLVRVVTDGKESRHGRA